MALRKCTTCGVVAETMEQLELFCKSKKHTHGRENRCKACNKLKTKKYRESSGPEKVLNSQIKSKYHVTLEEYTNSMNTSDNCEKCGKFTDLVYDHDHSTMKFRGVLCRQCNMGIGLLGDTEQGVQQALEYFKKVKERRNWAK